MNIPRIPMRFFTTRCCHCPQAESIGLHSIGGFTDGGTGIRDVNWAYSVDDTWVSKASLSSTRRGLMGEQIGGLGYVFGGLNSSSAEVSTAEEYTPGTDSWSTLTSVPTTGSRGTANSDGTDAFVLRGIEVGASVANHQGYDVSGDSWATKASLFSGATQNYFKMVGFSFSGKCHALGGQYVSGVGVVINENKQYDVSGDSWTAKATFTTSRGSACGESDGSSYGYIWCGGGYAGAGLIKDLRRYDLSGNSWSNLTAPAFTIYDGASGYDSTGTLYSMGGGNRDTPTTINAYKYDIGTTTWTALTDLPDVIDENVGMGGLV